MDAQIMLPNLTQQVGKLRIEPRSFEHKSGSSPHGPPEIVTALCSSGAKNRLTDLCHVLSEDEII